MLYGIFYRIIVPGILRNIGKRIAPYCFYRFIADFNFYCVGGLPSSPTSSQTLEGFTDTDKISSYALNALRWAVEQDILQGKGDGVLDPTGQATRAEVAAILQRFCQISKM